MSSLLQKDFHNVATNCEPLSDIIDADNSCKRKIFFMSIFTVLLINVLFSFIVYNI